MRFRTSHLDPQDQDEEGQALNGRALEGRGVPATPQPVNSASAAVATTATMEGARQPLLAAVLAVLATLCLPFETVGRSLKRGGLSRGRWREADAGCPKANSPVRSRTPPGF